MWEMFYRLDDWSLVYGVTEVPRHIVAAFPEHFEQYEDEQPTNPDNIVVGTHLWQSRKHSTECRCQDPSEFTELIPFIQQNGLFSGGVPVQPKIRTSSAIWLQRHKPALEKKVLKPQAKAFVPLKMKRHGFTQMRPDKKRPTSSPMNDARKKRVFLQEKHRETFVPPQGNVTENLNHEGLPKGSFADDFGNGTTPFGPPTTEEKPSPLPADVVSSFNRVTLGFEGGMGDFGGAPIRNSNFKDEAPQPTNGGNDEEEEEVEGSETFTVVPVLKTKPAADEKHED